MQLNKRRIPHMSWSLFIAYCLIGVQLFIMAPLAFIGLFTNNPLVMWIGVIDFICLILPILILRQKTQTEREERLLLLRAGYEYE